MVSVRRHLAALAILLSIAGGLGWYAVSHIAFQSTLLTLLPEDLPEVRGLKMYQDLFPSRTDLMVVVEGEDPDTAAAAAEELGRALTGQGLVEKAWTRPPWVQMEEGLESLDPEAGAALAYLWMNAEPDAVKAMAATLQAEPAAAKLADSMERLATGLGGEDALLALDPLGLTRLPGGTGFGDEGSNRMRFASPSGKFRAMFCQVPAALYLPDRSFDAARLQKWMDSVQAGLAAWQQSAPAGVTAGVTGRAAIISESTRPMIGEMMSSMAGTLLVVSGLFWMTWRRILPLLWVLTLLLLATVITLQAGLWIFGELSFASACFAAILLGLVVDYGFVIYEESSAAGGDVSRLRRLIWLTVAGAATTTALVFAGLNLSSLPGVRQMGTLVAIGVGVGAALMLIVFVRIAARLPARPAAERPAQDPAWLVRPRTAAVATAVAALFAVVVLGTRGLPQIATDPNNLRPKHSQVWPLQERAIAELSGGHKQVSILFSAKEESGVTAKLRAAEQILSEAMADEHLPEAGRPVRYRLPLAVWPQGERFRANRSILGALTTERERLRSAWDAAGFSPEAFALTDRVLETWGQLAAGKRLQPPDDDISHWLLDRVIAPAGPVKAAVGLIQFPDDSGPSVQQEVLEELHSAGIDTASWDHLRPAILKLTRRDFFRAFLPMVGILVLMLVLIFRGFREVALAMLVMVFSGAVLMAVMRVLGLDWNLVNLCAAPLLLGSGLDYCIHMQIAIRKNHGAAALAQRKMWRALSLCALTTAAGFGSLMLSENQALDSLGRVCALGTLIVMLVSLLLLPAWWWILRRR